MKTYYCTKYIDFPSTFQVGQLYKESELPEMLKGSPFFIPIEEMIIKDKSNKVVKPDISIEKNFPNIIIRKISIKSDSLEVLQKIKEISKTTAQKIIKLREKYLPQEQFEQQIKKLPRFEEWKNKVIFTSVSDSV